METYCCYKRIRKASSTSDSEVRIDLSRQRPEHCHIITTELLRVKKFHACYWTSCVHRGIQIQSIHFKGATFAQLQISFPTGLKF
jgi:hypothetical protein